MTLSILIWLPVVGALVAAVVPRRFCGPVTALASAATLGIAISFLARFEESSGGLQFVTDRSWISALGIHYKLGLDGLNVFLVLLAAVVFLAAIAWAAVTGGYERPRTFFFWLAGAESAVLGAFCAQDLILFVAFFDLMLFPFYFLLGGWGGPDRVRATLKLVIYTLVGSLLMLAAAIATGVIAAQGGAELSYAFSALAQRPLAAGSQEWIFLFFAAAFIVKMPLFPVHGWMPDAYGNMPIPALAAFSGVLSKVAIYGFLRVCLPLFPEAVQRYQTLLLLIALASILYGSAMAFTTTRTRLIVGYSSVAQLGFITLGVFSLDRAGEQGAILQAVNHGLVTAPLFFIIALLAARAGGSEDLRDMGGIAFRAPVLAGLFLVVALATLAMPGSANFVGEFYILLGVFQAKAVFAVVAFTGVVLASVYMLRAFIGSVHNRTGERVRSRDVRPADALVLVPLVLAIIALAVYPQIALRRSQQTVNRLVSPQGEVVDLTHPEIAVNK